MPLPSADRAAFAVSSRLLACLVTESLLPAVFLPLPPGDAVGACVILSTHADPPYAPAQIFAIVLLCSAPVLKPRTERNEIGLVDPLDMLPCICDVREDGASMRQKVVHPVLRRAQLDLPAAVLSSLPLSHDNATPCLSLDPLYWWRKFSAPLSLDHSIAESIAEELNSSCLWQKHAYETSRPPPTFASSSLEWEHSIVEGHPTHPMHRARRTLPPIPTLLPGQYDFHFPRVRFVSFPRADILLHGDFEALLAPLRAAAAHNAARPFAVPDDRVLLPVHELQVPNIAAHFPDATILPPEFSVLTPAQASLRTVTLPCAPHLTLKLALGITISSALRTISHYTAHAGPRFSAHIAPRLAVDPAVLHLEPELASAVHRHPDPAVARHAAALLRAPHAPPGEIVIVAAALASPAGIAALRLPPDPTAHHAFLAHYIDLLLAAVLPPLLTNGVALEAHAQNTLARFDRASRQLTGFAIRDFGGLRVHAPSLAASTGGGGGGGALALAAHILPGHCAAAPDAHALHAQLYHALVTGHLARLIRVLGAHHDGRGWALVRASLARRVPRDSPLWRAWIDPAQTTVPGKCFLRMKMAGVYREALYEEVPNLLQYRPQKTVVAAAAEEEEEEEEEEN